MLHEVARRLRESTDELARTMTAEGGKPLVENRDEIDWTAAAFDYYAEIGRDCAGRVIPPIESTPARARRQGAARRRRLHRALELPAAAARLEARAGAGRRQRGRRQAVRADAALDADARRLLRPPAGRASSTSSPAPATIGAALVRRRARRLHRLHRLGRDRQARSRSPAPSGSRGSTSRWAARTRSSSAPTSPTRSRSPPAAAPGPRSSTPARSAPRPSASTSMDDVYDDFVDAFVEHTRSLVARRPARRRDRRRPDGLGAAARTRSSTRSRRRSRPAPRSLAGGGAGGQHARPLLRPAVVTGAPAETDLLREETFGPVAPIVPVDASTRRSSSPTAPASASAPTSTRATCESAVRCMRELRAGTVWINDPLTDNDAGPFGGFKQSGLGRELGPRGPRGLPGDQARPHRDRDRAQGLVVPLRSGGVRAASSAPEVSAVARTYDRSREWSAAQRSFPRRLRRRRRRGSGRRCGPASRRRAPRARGAGPRQAAGPGRRRSANANAVAVWPDGNEVEVGIRTWRAIGTFSAIRSGRERRAERLDDEVEERRGDADRGEAHRGRAAPGAARRSLRAAPADATESFE